MSAFTPSQVLSTLRARGLRVAARGGKLSVTPAVSLTPADRDLIKAHCDAILGLLAIDDVERASAEAREAELRAHFAPKPPRVVFRTARGFLNLRELNVAEVRDLTDKGKLTSDEIAEWGRYR